MVRRGFLAVRPVQGGARGDDPGLGAGARGHRGGDQPAAAGRRHRDRHGPRRRAATGVELLSPEIVVPGALHLAVSRPSGQRIVGSEWSAPA